jgi:hypothetical protein
MIRRTYIPVLIGSLALGTTLLTGCGKEAAHNEAEHGEHAEEGEGGGGGATFKEGSGLLLAPEVVRALSITTVEAAERSLARTLNVTAQVYATGSGARAVALVSAGQAEGLKPGLRATVKSSNEAVVELTAISRIAEKASGQVELVFSLANAPTLALGDTVTLTISIAADSPALVVPRSALLDTATGTFVYVVNGTAYLRTPVKTGAADDNYIEITEGLYEGDTVVVTPVNQLWLSELRLTKGGGHSH